MDEIKLRGIMIYFKKMIAKDMTERLIQNPCEVNLQALVIISSMSDDMFYEVMKPILANMFDENKEKRETGIEPATPSLARRCSTAEPLAHVSTGKIPVSLKV